MSEKETTSDPAFEALLEFLKQNRGFDFRTYKRPSLMRRVSRRMQTVQIESFEDYIDYLEVHPDEFTHLFNTILINVTGFFRDEEAWAYLAEKIVPQILAVHGPEEPIRVWSAGCASGEEAYTIAMVLAEAMGVDAFCRRVKIYATDIDDEALYTARQAMYNCQAIQAVPAEWRDKYFQPINGSLAYTFRNDMRRTIIFGRNNLVQDAPISRLDLLICRNTFMYFNAEAQARILARFHFALNDSGFLFLGKAEMLLTYTSLFAPVEMKHRIFTKVPRANVRDQLLVITKSGEQGDNIVQQARLRESAFETVPLAQIVVDRDGNLVLANNQARTFFGLHTRDVGRPLQDLELSYRPVELRSLIEQAYQLRQTIWQRGVEWRRPNAPVQYLEIEVMPLWGSDSKILGVSVLFNDVSQFHHIQEELQRSKEELETAHEELLSSNEELETTNEELQSTNEELETTNEELQSTNEELKTMNEELQSTNEELQTMNDELRLRTQELNHSNAFLEAVLASLRAGIVVLDHEMNVMSWNNHAEALWGVRAEEARGKRFLDLDIGLPVAELKQPIQACLTGRKEFQEMIVAAVNRRGKTIQCRVTCSPLVGIGNTKPGVILLMDEWWDENVQ